jgi:hypothetical protein
MSNDGITQSVAAAIFALGRGTVDDVLNHVGGRLTRQQVLKALGNAKKRGLISIVGRTQNLGKTGGGPKGIYARATEENTRRVEGMPVAKPAASVWDTAQSLELVPKWPPPFDGARAINLMGQWD